MELIENLLQLLVTFAGALLSGLSYRRSRRQAYFLLLCFYGCFALGALYWTLYLLLFDTTPKVFYVSEFGWVASVIFLRILQATLAGEDEHSFRCRRAWLAPKGGTMSDNRKYYYLKLKENYFDEDAIVLLESMHMTRSGSLPAEKSGWRSCATSARTPSARSRSISRI